MLLENLANWKMLCSCLDAIGDTELAFVAFLKQRKTADYGQKYLSVYGVLQAMFVQQDAVENFPLEVFKHKEIKYGGVGITV